MVPYRFMQSQHVRMYHRMSEDVRYTASCNKQDDFHEIQYLPQIIRRCSEDVNTYRFLQPQDRAHEIQHVSQNDMQMALQAALGGAARLASHIPIQKGFAQHGLKVLAVSCNHAVQVCGSLQNHWQDGVDEVVL